MSEPIFKKGDIIVASKPHGSDELGVIEQDFHDGADWVQATTKSHPNMTSFRAPGFRPKEVRLATEAEVAQAPDFFHSWLQERKDAEARQRLNAENPQVRGATRRATHALRQIGVKRMSDLARFTDNELLALPGVGKVVVERWRKEAAFLGLDQSATDADVS